MTSDRGGQCWGRLNFIMISILENIITFIPVRVHHVNLVSVHCLFNTNCDTVIRVIQVIN